MPEEQNIAPPPEEAGEPKSDAPKNEPRNAPKKEAETTLGPKDADGASTGPGCAIGSDGPPEPAHRDQARAAGDPACVAL